MPRESPGLLRPAALPAALSGAAFSVAFLLYAGRGNNQRLLTVIMAGWVAAPFALLAVIHRFSKSWPASAQAMRDRVTFLVTLAALIVYIGNAISPPKAQAAFVFVVFPLAAWLAVAMVVLFAALVSRRNRT
jgi:hypothetical protein